MILVHIETDLDGTASEVSLEAVTFARNLSAEGGGVAVDAVVFNDLSDDLHKELAAYGVRTVHRVGGDDVAAYSGAGWASAILTVREAARSVVVMAAGTDRGMELMAHVGARAGVAMAANVISFSGLAPFVVTRQVAGGAAREEMVLNQRPAVFTVAGHALEATPATESGPADVVEHSPAIAEADLVARVVSSEEPEEDLSGALSSARVVVGAGRGVGGADKFEDVLELTAAARRDPRRLARGHQRRLAAAPRAGRPDRQPDLTRALHPVRHQRRHPALGGLRVGQEHPGHQLRRRGAYGDQGDVRRDRRPPRDRPGDQRRDPPPPRLTSPPYLAQECVPPKGTPARAPRTDPPGSALPPAEGLAGRRRPPGESALWAEPTPL